MFHGGVGRILFHAQVCTTRRREKERLFTNLHKNFPFLCLFLCIILKLLSQHKLKRKFCFHVCLSDEECKACLFETFSEAEGGALGEREKVLRTRLSYQMSGGKVKCLKFTLLSIHQF